MNKKCRIEIFDILKGIAVLAVIAGHVAQTYHMDRVMQFMYSFHMPMFFMISGYFIRTDEDDARFIKRKAKSLLCPYGIACLVLIMAKTGIALIKGRNALGIFGKWCYVSLYGTGSGRGSVYLSGG